MPPAATLSTSVEPGATEVAEARRLAERAAAADGSAPLNEAALLHLQHPRSEVQHLLARLDELLVGYAQLELGGQTSVAQLVVDPAHRRQGIGTQLAERLTELTPAGLQAWSPGASAGAAALAARVGLVIGRELNIMRRDLSTDWREPAVPADVEIRPFRVGADEADWLVVNARAFAHHPEQGSITAADLAQRMSEPWFDPAGFLLAIRHGSLVGFHWTKQHPDHLGEVYVLGVDPQASGSGLGKVLLAAGLRHLRERGNTAVELYVESDHRQAVGLYRGYGFTTVSRDVMYVQPPSSSAGPATSPVGH